MTIANVDDFVDTLNREGFEATRDEIDGVEGVSIQNLPWIPAGHGSVFFPMWELNDSTNPWWVRDRDFNNFIHSVHRSGR